MEDSEVERQNADGSWDEEEFTGTGFPCVFYLKYHLYRNYFPLYALSRYRNMGGNLPNFRAVAIDPEALGVDAALITQHGAVSEKVARAMAFGAVRHSQAQVSVAVTGVAGPTGGTPLKPVGTVWFGFQVNGQLSSETRHFAGDRAAVRVATVEHALQRLLELLA